MIKITLVNLPMDGLSREADLLPFLPFGKSTLWQWSKDGRFPKPIKLSSKMTVWKNQEVHMWLNSIEDNMELHNDK